MQKVQLSWILYANELATIEKYCKNCRRTTLLPTRIFADIMQTERTYTDLQFINVRKIIRGIKNFIFINHLLITSKLSI